MEQQASAAATSLFQYGVLGVVAVVLGLAIIYLFRTSRSDAAAKAAQMDKERQQWAEEREQWAEEREQWAVERASIRTEYERKHREQAESYAQALRDEHAANRAHEDLVRSEFADLMEKVAAEGGKASHAVVEVMQRMYDRVARPPRGR